MPGELDLLSWRGLACSFFLPLGPSTISPPPSKIWSLCCLLLLEMACHIWAKPHLPAAVEVKSLANGSHSRENEGEEMSTIKGLGPGRMERKKKGRPRLLSSGLSGRDMGHRGWLCLEWHVTTSVIPCPLGGLPRMASKGTLPHPQTEKSLVSPYILGLVPWSSSEFYRCGVLIRTGM